MEVVVVAGCNLLGLAVQRLLQVAGKIERLLLLLEVGAKRLSWGSVNSACPVKIFILIIIFNMGYVWQNVALSRRLELWDVPLFLLANPAWTEESEPDKLIHLYSPHCLKVWLAMNWL